MAVTYGTSIPTSGLAMLLDAGNSRSYSGTGSSWNDLANGGTSTSLIASPTYSSSNLGYLIFNGTSQYASVASASSSMPLSGRNLSVSTWFRLTGYSQNYSNNWVACMFSSNNPSTNAGILFYVVGTASSWTGLGIFGNVGTITNTTSYSFSLNTWYNVCITRTSAGLYTYYVNGSLLSTYSSVSSWTDNTTYAVGFNNYPGFQYYFPGHISVVHVYNNAALSRTEVNGIFNAYRGRYGI